jgi:hypothetical protein
MPASPRGGTTTHPQATVAVPDEAAHSRAPLQQTTAFAGTAFTVPREAAQPHSRNQKTHACPPSKQAKNFQQTTESKTAKMITTIQTGHTYHVTGDKPQSIQEDLDSAVELARHQATKDGGHGILVTRLGPGSFTVTVSADVPYGITQESCQIWTPRQRVMIGS